MKPTYITAFPAALLLLLTSITATAQAPLPYTGRDTEGIKGDVERMSTSAGKEVGFDADGNLVSISDKYRFAVSEYSDPYHYTTDHQWPMEVSFPDEFTRLEKGPRDDDDEVVHTYTFDGERRIRNIVLDDVYSRLHVEYGYSGQSRFPERMEIEYSNEAGSWMESLEFTYWSFDYTGNWIQRMVNGWTEETGQQREEFSYTETAVYNYSAESTGAADYESPDFTSFTPHHTQSLVTTEHDGVFSLFDDRYLYGWTMFFFIPRDEDPTKWYERRIRAVPEGADTDPDKTDALLDELNGRSFRQLSDEFDIYAYNIPKEHLLYFPLGDSPYEGAAYRMEFVYGLDYQYGRSVIRQNFRIEPDQGSAMWSWLEELLEGYYR